MRRTTKKLPIERKQDAVMVTAPWAILLCLSTLLGCSEKKPDEQSVRPKAAAAPPDNPERDEYLIEAYLDNTKAVSHSAECFGAKLGKVELGCDLAIEPEYRRFLSNYLLGVEEVFKIRRDVPTMADRVTLRLTIAGQGHADGERWDPNSPNFKSVYATYLRLAPTFDDVVLLPNDYGHWNEIAAMTRSMVLVDVARRHVRHHAHLLGAEGFVDTHYEILPPVVWEARGPEYRGATLRASLKLGLRDKTHRQRIVAALEEHHWVVKTSG